MTDAQRQACEELILLRDAATVGVWRKDGRDVWREGDKRFLGEMACDCRACIANAAFIAHAANHAAYIARALLDTAAAPAWHDAPTGPGLWCYVTTAGDFGFWTVRMSDDQTFPTGRFYGPIPEDQP